MSLDQAEMTVKQDLECAFAALDMQRDDFLELARGIRQKVAEEAVEPTELEAHLG
ncbi:hypothetical protein ACFQDN_15370 [Pseudomonas asuensis]|uniref:Uncharacterized protein n=1 Tax=Pseudomonas asuensis TaxID=1825787 RepID=A0ABQ2GKS8_9PSED|nr:hypothetical protein [Pseudomonas asuensis]GGM00258.1 hypothetical protein GCM10009425_09220 [Pseudomonas asuensis]